MRPPLLFAMSMATVHGAPYHHRYFSYPTGLTPAESTADFSLFNASTLIAETNKTDVLDTYQFSKNFRGFVFDIDEKVKFILARTAVGTNFTNDWGRLGQDSDTGATFYEQIPVSNDNQVFMYKFFDFVRYEGVTPKDYTCIATAEILSTDKTLEEHCRDIPRCMGYVEGHCLVSTFNRDSVLEADTGKVFHEKKRVHDTIKGIKDNFILFWSLYGTVVAIFVAFPSLLSKLGGHSKSKARVSNIY